MSHQNYRVDLMGLDQRKSRPKTRWRDEVIKELPVDDKVRDVDSTTLEYQLSVELALQCSLERASELIFRQNRETKQVEIKTA